MIKVEKLSNILLGISAVLFLLSLTMRVFLLAEDQSVWSWGMFSNWPGYSVLLFGWLLILGGGMAWFANPLLLCALFLWLIKRYNAGLIFSLIALMFALTSVAIDSLPQLGTIYGMGLGFFFWVGSICFVCVALLIRVFSQSQTKGERLVADIASNDLDESAHVKEKDEAEK